MCDLRARPTLSLFDLGDVEQPRRMQHARTGAGALQVFPRLSKGHCVPTLDPSQRRENKMATKHTSTNGLRQKLAALAISAALFAACGSTTQRASVVHDPSNPYWVGSDPAASGHAASTPSVTRATILRDPENPYWQLSQAPARAYVDPVRGDH